MREWTVVEKYPSRVMAEMMAELLRNEGIPSTVQSDDGSGVQPQLAYTLGVRVLVPADRVEEARALLREHGGEEGDDGVEDEEAP